jgi:hypothetical protein
VTFPSFSTPSDWCYFKLTSPSACLTIATRGLQHRIFGSRASAADCGSTRMAVSSFHCLQIMAMILVQFLVTSAAIVLAQSVVTSSNTASLSLGTLSLLSSPSLSSSSSKPSTTSSSAPPISEFFNRGPLTTTFSPPISCLSTATEVTLESSVPSLVYGHYFFGSLDCYPPVTVPTGPLSTSSYWVHYYCKFFSDHDDWQFPKRR